jgi:hypothetical protein
VKLLRATFLSIRGLPDLTWDLGRAGTDAAQPIAVVTGPPASGKTRVLEAIACAKEVLGSYGPPPDADAWIRGGERAAKIELTFALDEDERRSAGKAPAIARGEALFGVQGVKAEIDDGIVDLLERYEHDAARPKWDYAPATRAIPLLGAPHGTSAIEQRALRLKRDPRKYAFVPRFLAEIAPGGVARERFENALARLAPALQFVGATVDEPTGAFASRGRNPVGVDDLASSEQDAIVFAATAALVRMERSIWLIDRPESATDERGVGGFVAALGSLAEGLQLIVASSSPNLVASVDPAAVLHLAS